MSTLVTFVGNPNTAGGKLKETGTIHWNNPNTGATDDYGFSVFGTGCRGSTGFFFGIGEYVYLMVQSGMAYRVFAYNSSTIELNVGNNNEGNNVRCLRDTDPGTLIITDYDGNNYDVLHLGNQYWLKQDLKTTHYNDGTLIPNVTDTSTWSTLTTGAFCAYNNDLSNI
jgi:hypothetical protein